MSLRLRYRDSWVPGPVCSESAQSGEPTLRLDLSRTTRLNVELQVAPRSRRVSAGVI